MKVLQLLPELNSGGVERGVVELNREFVKLGIESHVASNGGKLVESITTHGGIHHTIDVCSKNLFTAPVRARRLSYLFRSLAPDIIHARSRIPAWLALLGRSKMPSRSAFVTTVHGLNSVNPYSKVMTYGKRVICVSEVVKNYIIKNYNTEEHKIRIIQRGVDMNYFNPANCDSVAVQSIKDKFKLNGKFVVSSVGRITWLKDFETFISSISKLKDSHPDIMGLIVGETREDKWEYQESLFKLVEDLGVQKHITFTGNISDIRSIYACSNVVVNASLKMGNMGRTVVEALAMGVPVIATSFEGLNNLVVDGQNGFVIKNKDVEGLRKALRELIQNKFETGHIRSSVPNEFTLDAMVENVIGVYKELIQPQRH